MDGKETLQFEEW